MGATNRTEQDRTARESLPDGKAASNRQRASDGFDPEFDRFWRAYPKKEAPGKARRAWDELNPDAALIEAILAAVEWQRKREQWQEPQFIPLAHNWLKAERWRDEAPVDPRETAAEEERKQSQETLARIRQDMARNRGERSERSEGAQGQ
jgi:hypothetical protein